jgi:uncharacterized coiled-coil protein SlyX
MAKTKTGGQAARRSPKKTSRKRTASRKPSEKKQSEVNASPLLAEKHEQPLADAAMEKTRQQLHKLTEKLHEAAEKSIHAIKEVAADIQLYAKDTTELTKIRIDLNHMIKERQKLLMLMGEKLRNMHRANKLTRIPAKFADDFRKLDDLEDEIEEMKKTEDALAEEIKNV